MIPLGLIFGAAYYFHNTERKNDSWKYRSLKSLNRELLLLRVLFFIQVASVIALIVGVLAMIVYYNFIY